MKVGDRTFGRPYQNFVITVNYGFIVTLREKKSMPLFTHPSVSSRHI